MQNQGKRSTLNTPYTIKKKPGLNQIFPIVFEEHKVESKPWFWEIWTYKFCTKIKENMTAKMAKKSMVSRIFFSTPNHFLTVLLSDELTGFLDAIYPINKNLFRWWVKCTLYVGNTFCLCFLNRQKNPVEFLSLFQVFQSVNQEKQPLRAKN